MKIPTSFKILGKTYRVKYDSLQDTGFFGLVDVDEKIVVLDSRITGYKLQQTFMHEIIHVIQYESGLAEIQNENDTF